MSVYPNKTERNLINLANLAEQQKNQWAIEIENKFSKQTHDKKLPHSFETITKKLEQLDKPSKN